MAYSREQKLMLTEALVAAAQKVESIGGALDVKAVVAEVGLHHGDMGLSARDIEAVLVAFAKRTMLPLQFDKSH